MDAGLSFSQGLTPPNAHSLQKQLDDQQKGAARERAAPEREEAALEMDASNRIQNRLLVQLEILRRSLSSHDCGTGGSRDNQSPPRLNNSPYVVICRRRNQSYSPNDGEYSDSSEPHKASKIPRIKGFTELV